MLYAFFYALRTVLKTLKNRKGLDHDDVIRGLRCYIATPKRVRKTVLKTIFEVNHLCKYWHCWPDMYFRFGHFRKSFTDMKQIESFVPQFAYGLYTWGGAECSEYKVLINDKVIFHDLMNYYNLPIPKLHFVYDKFEFFVKNEVVTDDVIDGILTKISDSRIFVKRHTGGAGSGVFIFTKGKDGYYDGENKVSASYIRSKYQNEKIFFEKQLIQSEPLRSFNPDTVNTIRVMTLNKDGNNPEVISAAVRFGRKGNYVDNTAKGGVAVSLDIDSGMLGSWGIREYDLNAFYEHPDTHKKFEGVVVPQWSEIKELVVKTLNHFPPYRSVGFDVVTSDHGPVIIEINTGAGIYLSQMGKDYGPAEKFNNIIPRY